MSQRPPIALVVTTVRWLASARVALALSEAGFVVKAACPKGHALRAVSFVSATTTYRPLAPLRSVREAIETCRPDLIVPTDDRAVAHLIEIYASATGDDPRSVSIRAVIARSLGATEHFPVLYSRTQIAIWAQEQGINFPAMAVVSSQADLTERLAQIGLPAVLKTDGSWGGDGTIVVRSAPDAARALRQLAAPPGLPRVAKRLAIDKDVHFLVSWIRRERPVVNVQRFAVGRPANVAAACWQGEVLSQVSVEAVRTTTPTGPATVVRTIRNPEMSQAVERMVKRLNMSGMCGFDFLLDDAGDAHLLEINPRATPTCHLVGAEGIDLAQALRKALDGERFPRGSVEWESELIALFPQEMLRDPASEYLESARHDVPARSEEFVALGYDTVHGKSWLVNFVRARQRRQAAKFGDARLLTLE